MIGIKARPLLNGREGVIGALNTASGRCVFKAGSESILVKAPSLELVGKKTREVLRAAFHKAARQYDYGDPIVTDMLFERLYDEAAQKGYRVGKVVERLCSDEAVFNGFFAGELQFEAEDL